MLLASITLYETINHNKKEVALFQKTAVPDPVKVK
jgi:hypothetical protein